MSMIQDIIRLPNGILGIAAQHYQGLSHVHKFGAVPAMSNNDSGTIWDVNNTDYPWSSWDSTGTIQIPAVNASDNDKEMVIEGLDANYNLQSTTVTLDSGGVVATGETWARVFRAYIVDDDNVGDVLIQKSSVTIAKITAGKSQTLMAIYTVPAGHTAYILKGTATCQDGADATGDMFVRYDGQTSFRVGHSFEVCGDGGQYVYDFGVPLRIPEKSDIDIRATVRSNNARLTAAFDMILEVN